MPLFQEAMRRERLGVNLFDLERIDPFVRSQMRLSDRLDLGAPVWVDRNRPDEHAVAFKCDFLTAALLCDVIRHRDRQAGVYPTRVYLFREAWSKLPSTAVLTVVVRGTSGVERCVLNPELLKPPPPPPAKPSPLPVKRAAFGSTVCGDTET